ncbi:MAG: DUF4153 domain-containing protein [Ignavibacteriales bacterium]|nr:DUF4153 domain-containing protein [Ignavibacteriales bacterium]
MKLPTLKIVINETLSPIGRFPLAMAALLVAVISGIQVVNVLDNQTPSLIVKLFLTAILGAPLMLSFELYSETKTLGRMKKMSILIFLILILSIYFMLLPENFINAVSKHHIRFLLLLAAVHLIVSFVPFSGIKNANGFWQFNITLLSRWGTSFIYSNVLYAGFALSFLALDRLFGFNIIHQRYMQLWIVICIGFNTLYFAGGIPNNFQNLTVAEIPRVIKNFAQYILASLILVYAVILYIYVGKIVITWSWPQGWVSRLIISFAVLGFLTNLLLSPNKELLKNAWSETFRKWFLILLLPLILILVLALSERVDNYGLTESRILGYIIAAWLFFISVYFLFGSRQNIKMIPASLTLILLLISYGPLSLFNIAENNQITRLTEILTANKTLVQGKVIENGGTLNKKDQEKIYKILEYLRETHGFEKIEGWFSVPILDKNEKKINPYLEPEKLMALMGIKYDKAYQSNYFLISVQKPEELNISGFENVIADIEFNKYNATEQKFSTIALKLNDKKTDLLFNLNGSRRSENWQCLNLANFCDSMIARNGTLHEIKTSQQKLVIDIFFAEIKIKFVFSDINLLKTNFGYEITSVKFSIFLKK